jgi:endogenous inhibitor of DNA gyrase (YacG/DUF329 family)
MADRDLLAHSLAEAYLYLMVTACPTCGKGPLVSSEARVLSQETRLRTAAISASCRACHAPSEWRFQILHATGGGGQLNPSPQPSRLIDLGQWITLSRIITEAAGRSEDRIQARGFRIQASECLDEALKFFEQDDSRPPATAFFTSESTERFLAHPEQFERSKVLELRDRLPTSRGSR